MSKKERLKPRKVRRAEARAKGVAFVPQYNFTSGPNRADRRAMVKMGRLLFNKGLWVRELAIAIRGMMRRAGMFDGRSVQQAFTQKWIKEQYALSSHQALLLDKVTP